MVKYNFRTREKILRQQSGLGKSHSERYLVTFVAVSLALLLIAGVIELVWSITAPPSTATEQEKENYGLVVLVLVGVIVWASLAAIFMIDADNSTKGLGYITQIDFVIVSLLAFIGLVGRSLKSWYLTSAAIAIGIKAYELSVPGHNAQQDLAFGLFAVCSVLLFACWLVQTRRSQPKPAPTVWESPIDCKADPEHMRLYHNDQHGTPAAPASEGKPNLRKDL